VKPLSEDKRKDNFKISELYDIPTEYDLSASIRND